MENNESNSKITTFSLICSVINRCFYNTITEKQEAKEIF